jgi:hypothetical protein
MAMNLKAEDYLLNLGDFILDLMGLEGERNEIMFEYYLDMIKRANYADDSKNNAEFKKMATEIYQHLQIRKPLN